MAISTERVDPEKAVRLATPAVRSALDAAFWFLDRVESAGRPSISNHKLQALLYLVQAAYAQANEGRKLMPATFLATENGPIEPTVFHIFLNGIPRIVATVPPRRSTDPWPLCGRASTRSATRKRVAWRPRTRTTGARSRKGK